MNVSDMVNCSVWNEIKHWIDIDDFKLYAKFIIAIQCWKKACKSKSWQYNTHDNCHACIVPHASMGPCLICGNVFTIGKMACRLFLYLFTGIYASKGRAGKNAGPELMAHAILILAVVVCWYRNDLRPNRRVLTNFHPYFSQRLHTHL